MPIVLERKLKKEAAQHKGWDKKRKNAYVYGTLNKLKAKKRGKKKK